MTETVFTNTGLGDGKCNFQKRKRKKKSYRPITKPYFVPPHPHLTHPEHQQALFRNYSAYTCECSLDWYFKMELWVVVLGSVCARGGWWGGIMTLYPLLQTWLHHWIPSQSISFLWRMVGCESHRDNTGAQCVILSVSKRKKKYRVWRNVNGYPSSRRMQSWSFTIHCFELELLVCSALMYNNDHGGQGVIFILILIIHSEMQRDSAFTRRES